MKRICAVLVVVGLSVAVAAAAQNASTPGTPELYATLNAIGVRLAYTGDANANATARLEWRRQGETAWIPGMAMTRISGPRWAASVLWLGADTPYEVRAVIDDSDGGGTSAAVSARTRSRLPTAPSGRTIWVAPNGSDSNSGSSAAPLKTVQAGVNLAQPGEEVRVRPGVYYEAVDPPRSGTAAAPIHLVADGAGVVLDGSDPAYLRRTDWTAEGGGVHSVPFTASTRLVCADSLQRLYRHASLADLQANANGMTQGWVIANSRLYVKLEDGSSPAGHVMHVARLEYALYLDVAWWRVSGLELRHYGIGSGASGISLRGASHCDIIGNHIHTVGGRLIYLRALAADNLIEGNLLRDPRIGGWPWAATKGHEEEQQAVSNRGGRGNVIRGNTITGTFDGIDVANGESDENVGADTDIAENVITGTTDDAIEPEGISGINVRVLRNRVDGVFSGISMAPLLEGPTYIAYNVFTNYRRGGVKLSYSSPARIWIIHNTFASSVSGAPAVYPSGPYFNVHWRNNVMTATGIEPVSDDAGESETGCDFDGDLLFSTGSTLFRWKGQNYGSLASLRSATGFEQNGRAGDPRYVSAASGDYRLSAGSPAIDGALRLPGINDGFSGAGPDVGAYEFGSPDVIPPAAIQDLRVQP